MPKLQPQLIRDCSEGVIQDIDNAISPRNSVFLAVNLLFHKKLGRAVLRQGTTKIGNSLSGKCFGLHHFLPTDTNKKALLSVFGENLYKLDTDTQTWTSTTAVTKDAKMRFLTFEDRVLAVNGTMALSSEDGDTWATTGTTGFDLDNIPKGNIVSSWKNRVYIAGVSGEPSTLYASSLALDGNISWTDDTAFDITIEPADNAGAIVGLSKVPGYLLIFKERAIKRWNGQSTFPEDLINIGTLSQESIVLARQSVFFWNERGVFETQGGYPRKVSRRIQRIVDAVNPQYEVSGWSDKDNVYFSVGNIYLDDLLIENCVIAYNLDSQVWTALSFPTDFIVWSSYVSGNDKVITGDNSGQVWELFSGVNDNGKDINYRIEWQEQEFGWRSRIKSLSQFVVFTEKVNSAELLVKANEGNYEPIGKVNENVEVLQGNALGNYFKFALIGSGSSAEIIGLEITELDLNISQKM